MKRLQVLFLVALSSSLMLFGCGKKDEEVSETLVQPIVEPITEPTTPEEESEEPQEPEDEADVPPQEGMVRSSLTNEWIDGSLKT